MQQNEADATIKSLKQEIDDKDNEITSYTNKILELNAELEQMQKNKKEQLDQLKSKTLANEEIS